MAGETSVRLRTKSGLRAAVSNAIVPPIEFPTRCIGAFVDRTMYCSSTRACAVSVKSNPEAGSEKPKPGRSIAAPGVTGASRACRSVQLVAEPPKPCTYTVPGGEPSPARRTLNRPPARGCVAPGQVGTNGTSEPRVSSDNCAASTTSGRSADHDGTTRSSERDSSPRSELLIHSELVMAPSMPHSDGPLATTVYRQ